MGAGLILTPAAMCIDGDGLHIHSRLPSELWFAVYPPIDGNLFNADAVIDHELAGVFRRYHLSVDEINVPLTLKKINEAGMPPPVKIGSQGVATPPDEIAFDMAETWLVQFPVDAFDGVQEIFLKVDYVGDVARAYLGDILAADDFYHGRAWEIGLRRLLPRVLEHGLTLQFLPLRKDAPIYMPPEYQPVFEGEAALKIKSITAVVEYQQIVKLSA
jgi:hypothetical protein